MINAVIFFWQVHIAKTNVKLTPGELLYTCTTFEPFLFYFFPHKESMRNKQEISSNKSELYGKFIKSGINKCVSVS